MNGDDLQRALPGYEIGRWSYGGLCVSDYGGGGTLKVGAFCSFGPGVEVLLGGEHRADWVSTYPFPALWQEAAGIAGHPAGRGDVVIGPDVWVGAGALILGGVEIGAGAVIGARSVVTHDVPPYGVAAGNPARVTRLRFAPHVVERLLAVAWWDWSDDEIQGRLAELCAPPEAA